MVLVDSSQMTARQRPTTFTAFYYSYIACPIQNQNFYHYANTFFAMKSPQLFGQKYPHIERVRQEKCRQCPAKLGFNGGEGLDCWINVPLPLNEEVYEAIYDSLNNYIRYNTRDSAIAKEYDSAINEIMMCEKSVLGAIMNGWIKDSSALKKIVTITTSMDEYNVSVASIVGYLIRDGVFLTHTGFLADLFTQSQALKYNYQSPLRGWSVLSNTALFSKVPIKVCIQCK